MVVGTDKGVRQRVIQGGDAWANEHRKHLGHHALMQDVDGMFGLQVFAQNTGDRLFYEYVPDHWENRERVVRHFGLVGVFDRKLSEDASSLSNVSTAFYLYLCRVAAKAQPVDPKFFFVVGENSPWKMIELDIYDGSAIGEPLEVGDDWPAIWNELGLTAIRQHLRRWVESP